MGKRETASASTWSVAALLVLAAIGFACTREPATATETAAQLPYEAMAARMVAALQPEPGERVLLRYDPELMHKLLDETRKQLEAAGAQVSSLPTAKRKISNSASAKPTRTSGCRSPINSPARRRSKPRRWGAGWMKAAVGRFTSTGAAGRSAWTEFRARTRRPTTASTRRRWRLTTKRWTNRWKRRLPSCAREKCE